MLLPPPAAGPLTARWNMVAGQPKLATKCSAEDEPKRDKDETERMRQDGTEPHLRGKKEGKRK